MEHKPKILIVEDNKFNHPLYRDAFEQAGFEVVISDDAEGYLPEAVNIVKPDIISMDLMIGKEGMDTERDGFSAIEALKSDLRTHDIPIIVFSSFFEEGKVRRARELGAVDFINSAGMSIREVPKQFLLYLENSKGYKPSHPLFR